MSAPQPKPLQVLQFLNTIQGPAWSSASDRLLASDGKDDVVLEIVRGVGIHTGPPLLPRASGACRTRRKTRGGRFSGQSAWEPPRIANLENDSVSLIDLASGQVLAERDLRPGSVDPKDCGRAGAASAALWRGLTGEAPYPATAAGAYLTANRTHRLDKAHAVGMPGARSFVTAAPVAGGHNG
jgi:hypothetical protein